MPTSVPPDLSTPLFAGRGPAACPPALTGALGGDGRAVEARSAWHVSPQTEGAGPDSVPQSVDIITPGVSATLWETGSSQL